MNFQAIREECCQANRSLPVTGLADLTFGNVSVLDREHGVFAIKPSGVSYDVLRPEDMVLVALEDGKPLGSELRPSSDTPTHRHLFQALPSLRAIVHTHSRHAVSFAQARRAIPCFGTTHADYFHGSVPVTRAMNLEEIQGEYEWNTGGVIAECLEGKDPLHHRAVLVCGHGPFAWGTTGSEAVEVAHALEIIAEMAWKTIQLDPECKSLPSALLDKHFFRKHGSTAYYGQG